METITLEYDVRNKYASQMIEIIQSLGLATRKSFALEGTSEKDIEVKSATAETSSALPFSVGLWADYHVDDRMLRSKAWGTHKRIV